MYIDKYNIENWGSTWSKGKEKKNQLIGSIKGNDIDIKNWFIYFKNITKLSMVSMPLETLI